MRDTQEGALPYTQPAGAPGGDVTLESTPIASFLIPGEGRRRYSGASRADEKPCSRSYDQSLAGGGPAWLDRDFIAAHTSGHRSRWRIRGHLVGGDERRRAQPTRRIEAVGNVYAKPSRPHQLRQWHHQHLHGTGNGANRQMLMLRGNIGTRGRGHSRRCDRNIPSAG